jgi:hypothetical protein
LLWGDVLTDQYVNLDKILSSLSGSGQDHDKQVIGDVEIMNLPTAPTCNISGSGEWIQVWTCYTKAVLFAYPHRVTKFSKYFEYMVGVFNNVPGR